MIRWRRRIEREQPLVAHLTTTDISLALLLGGQLHAYASSGFEVVGVSAPGPFVEQLTSLGIRHIGLASATRKMSLRADLRAMRELWRTLRDLRPDIVHTHNPKPGIYGRILAAAARTPVIVNTVHGLYATRTDRLRRRFVVYALERFAASFSDAELVQNPEDLETLSHLRLSPRKLVLLGNGVDLGRFSAGRDSAESRRQVREELHADPDAVIVLAVGRLVGEKGFREVFSAASLVGRDLPNVRFVVAGPDEPSKADRITDEEMDRARRDGVQFLGHREDVERLYQAADIYVLASHREGFPRSAMEAAAAGVPIVATDIRGCRQVVDDGETGLLVPVRDPRSLSEAISRLVRDPAERRRMGERAALKAAEEFDEGRIIGITLATYRDLVARARPVGGPAAGAEGRPPASA